MVSLDEKSAQFIREYIPKVSRTFALTIKFLPKELRDSVYVSYLLCRVADTLEDSPYIDADEKQKRLTHLRDILLATGTGGRLKKTEISSLYESINPEHGDDHKLLFDSVRLFEIIETLPESHRPIIYRWVAEMAGGMAEYINKIGCHTGGGIAVLKDIEEWDDYCYYVAGTVGNLLTGLFIEHYRFNGVTADSLRELGQSFGLGLQKVNVIKDVPSDRERGICYLPGNLLLKHELTSSSIADKQNSRNIEALVSELVNLTVPHFDDSLEYFIHFPGRLKSVRMFLIVPVFLALDTLSLVRSNPVQTMGGPPVKLSRAGVSRLVAAAALRIGSNKAISDYYKKLRSKAVSGRE